MVEVIKLSCILPARHWRCCWLRIFLLAEVVFVRSSKRGQADPDPDPPQDEYLKNVVQNVMS
jgi:hypothetical protein